MENKESDLIGNILIVSLLLLLSIGGYISYKSIDWTVLKRMEAQPLLLPTPAPVATESAQIVASPSATATTSPTKTQR